MRKPIAIVGAAIMVLSLLAITPSSAAERDTRNGAPSLYVIADSVVLGAKSGLQQTFAGWQVHMQGYPAIFAKDAADVAYANRHLIGDVAIVAVGYNYPYFDPDRFDRSIDKMVRVLTDAGAKQVIWVTLRRATKANSPRSGWFQVDRYAWYFPDVNRHLEAALDRHPQLALADWEAISGGSGLTYDAIHLNTAGSKLMSQLIYDSVESAGRRHGVREVFELQAANVGGVPADAAAVALNVTVTDPRNRGFLTVYPCSAPRPNASNLNFVRGQTVANFVVSDLGADGKVCIYSHDAAQVIVDLVGWFPSTSSFRSQPPRRALDTRETTPVPAGGVVRLPAARLGLEGNPTKADSVLLNVTATEPDRSGFLTVYPCDRRRPATSNVNYTAGETVPNFAIAKIGDGAICVFSLVESHVLVDVAGWFPKGAGPTMLPSPVRTLDTRAATGPSTATSVEVRSQFPAGTSSVIGNLTATETTGHGYATAYPCDAPRPLASTLNFDPADTVANAFISAMSSAGEVCFASNVATDFVIDVTAAFTDSNEYVGRNPVRLHDSRG